jgi:DNA-binding transcriptional ArsR family regulator
MSTLLQKEIKISKILSTNADQAKALDDAARIKILQILYRKQLATEQIVEELNKMGYKKATTTIRHHIDVLKNAGLIEIVKMEEVRGAVMKYYGTSVRVMGTKLPANFDADFSKTIAETSVRLEKMIKNIVENAGSKIKKKSSKNAPSESSYEEHIMMEIVNRAMTKVFENNTPLIVQK